MRLGVLPTLTATDKHRIATTNSGWAEREERRGRNEGGVRRKGEKRRSERKRRAISFGYMSFGPAGARGVMSALIKKREKAKEKAEGAREERGDSGEGRQSERIIIIK